jgi:protein-export membrane protein SecD
MRHLRPIPILLFLLVALLAACNRTGKPSTVVVLAADAIVPVDPATMEQARIVAEARLNALGVRDPRVTIEGTRLRVELPGVDDPTQAIAILSEQGLLEFIDAGTTFLPIGSKVTTTFPELESEGATGGVIASTVTVTPTETVTATTATTSTYAFPTVLTGRYLTTASVYRDSTSGAIGIQFELGVEGATILSEFTENHADNDVQPYYYLAILLDKEVVSCPHIVSAIPEGQGVIQGNFTLDEAKALAVQLHYGVLPVKLTVESVRTVP